MGSAIALREDFEGAALRRFAKTTKDAVQSRRLLALAEIYDGGRRLDGATDWRGWPPGDPGLGVAFLRRWAEGTG